MNNLEYCLEHSNISTVICAESNARNLLKISNLANLKNIVLCEHVDAQLEEQLKAKFNLYYFWNLIDE